MRQICIRVLVISWNMLLIVSCTNPNKNNSSNLNAEKEIQVAEVDSKTRFINSSEVIDGWLKKFIKQKEVIEKIGTPEKKGEDEYWEAIGAYVQNWEYTSLGIILEMESEKQCENKIVRSITIVRPCKLTTSQGISIGSEKKIVKERYVKLIDASISDENTIVVGSIYEGTIFTFTDSSVSRIFIGAVAE